MRTKLTALFIASVLVVCMATATDTFAHGSPTADGIPIQLKKVSDQLRPIESKISEWQREARLVTLLTVLVGLLGIVTVGIQQVDKRRIKTITLIIGMTISGITLVNNTVFHPSSTLKVYALQLGNAVDEIQRDVNSYEPDMAPKDLDRLTTTVQSKLSDAITLKANLEQKLAGEGVPAKLQTSTGFLPFTVVHASGEQPKPAWVSTPPTDTVYLYFVGKGESDSLQGAEEAADINAYDQGARQIAPQLGDSDLQGVRMYVATNSQVAATYFMFDRTTKKYSYYKLLKASKEFLLTGVAQALMLHPPEKVLLRLERIFCLQDGSPGATDWHFDIEYNGKTIIRLSRRSYSDKRAESKNGMKPLAGDHAEATIELPKESRALIEIVGYRSFGNKLSARGKTFVTVNGIDSPIEVKGLNENAGHFKFDFTVAKVQP